MSNLYFRTNSISNDTKYHIFNIIGEPKKEHFRTNFTSSRGQPMGKVTGTFQSIFCVYCVP